MKSLHAPVAMHAILMAIVLLLSACKGSNSDTTPQPPPQPTSAVVKLSTVGTLPAGKKIGAIDVTLTLAPGVTLKSTANPPEPDTGVVVKSGVAANTNLLIAANYTAPTSTQPGKVQIGIATFVGFETGEFLTINGDIAADFHPQAADFKATINTIADTDSNPLAGLAAGLAVNIR